MKIHFFITSVMMFFFSAVLAQNVLTISAKSNTAKTKALVTISLNNTDVVDVMPFDFIIPQGMTFSSCSATGRTKMKPQIDPETDEPTGQYEPSWNFTVNAANGVVSISATPSETQYKLNSGNGAICSIALNCTDYVGDGSEMILNSVSFASNATVLETSFPAGKIGNGGYSTFSAQQVHVKFDASKVKAYYGVVAGDVLNLVAADGNVVYQNNGVILKGTEGTSIIATSVPASEATAPTKNDLKDAPRGAIVEANSAYVLATDENGTCFYKYSGTTIPAGKAYLPASLVSSSGAPIRIEEETSGIETIEATTEQATVSYDLFGRANKSVKGAVAIENGKKVIRF